MGLSLDKYHTYVCDYCGINMYMSYYGLKCSFNTGTINYFMEMDFESNRLII